jgi:hypothetical protein
MPGTELHVGDYALNASNEAMQEIDLSASGISVSTAFRVGIELLNSGTPSVARDDDGNITPNRNFIFASGGSWFESSALGVTGDWIIRAVVSSGAPAAGEASILSVEDIGNDQGRQIRLSFARSAFDAIGAATPILNYEAYRRIDPLPGAKLAGWDFVASIPAHGDSEYSMVLPTLADSTITAGQHWSAFLVRATTAVPTVFFSSLPDSGYSVDNLAPSVPANLLMTGQQLDWDPAGESDFAYFAIYGSSSSAFDGSATILGETTDTSFDISASSHGYYHVTAHDFAGNEGTAASVTAATAVDAPRLPNVSLRAQPNPFNPSTSLYFELAEPGTVSLMIFDVRGRQVDTLLLSQWLPAGEHRIAYRSELPSGSYFVRLRTAHGTQNLRIALVR